MKINDSLSQYLKYLEKKGKSPMTLYTYGKDVEQIKAFFGDKELNDLTKLWIGRFLKSEELNKSPNGKSRAPSTISKTIGFFRRFIEWSLEQGYLTESPLPKNLDRTSN